MSRTGSSAAVLLMGAMVLRLTASGAYLSYVKGTMAPWLLLAGAALVLLGAAGLWPGRATDGGGAGHLAAEPGHGDESAPGALASPALGGRAVGAHTASAGSAGSAGSAASAASADDHGHDHGARAPGAWAARLLVVPVAVLLMVSPPALGSFGVGARTTAVTGTGVFPALPASSGPQALSLLELDQRAADRGGATLVDREVRLVGFVTAPVAGLPAGAFRIARFQIACCAADGVASIVTVQSAGAAAPARDVWVEVTGTLAGADADGVPVISPTAVRVIPAPLDPYEAA